MSASSSHVNMTESEVDRVEKAIESIRIELKTAQEFLKSNSESQNFPAADLKFMNDRNFDLATEEIYALKGSVQGIHARQKEVLAAIEKDKETSAAELASARAQDTSAKDKMKEAEEKIKIAEDLEKQADEKMAKAEMATKRSESKYELVAQLMQDLSLDASKERQASVDQVRVEQGRLAEQEAILEAKQRQIEKEAQELAAQRKLLETEHASLKSSQDGLTKTTDSQKETAKKLVAREETAKELESQANSAVVQANDLRQKADDFSKEVLERRDEVQAREDAVVARESEVISRENAVAAIKLKYKELTEKAIADIKARKEKLDQFHAELNSFEAHLLPLASDCSRDYNEATRVMQRAESVQSSIKLEMQSLREDHQWWKNQIKEKETSIGNAQTALKADLDKSRQILKAITDHQASTEGALNSFRKEQKNWSRQLLEIISSMDLDKLQKLMDERRTLGEQFSSDLTDLTTQLSTVSIEAKDVLETHAQRATEIVTNIEKASDTLKRSSDVLSSPEKGAPKRRSLNISELLGSEPRGRGSPTGRGALSSSQTLRGDGGGNESRRDDNLAPAGGDGGDQGDDDAATAPPSASANAQDILKPPGLSTAPNHLQRLWDSIEFPANWNAEASQKLFREFRNADRRKAADTKPIAVVEGGSRQSAAFCLYEKLNRRAGRFGNKPDEPCQRCKNDNRPCIEVSPSGNTTGVKYRFILREKPREGTAAETEGTAEAERPAAAEGFAGAEGVTGAESAVGEDSPEA